MDENTDTDPFTHSYAPADSTFTPTPNPTLLHYDEFLVNVADWDYSSIPRGWNQMTFWQLYCNKPENERTFPTTCNEVLSVVTTENVQRFNGMTSLPEEKSHLDLAGSLTLDEWLELGGFTGEIAEQVKIEILDANRNLYDQENRLVVSKLGDTRQQVEERITAGGRFLYLRWGYTLPIE